MFDGMFVTISSSFFGLAESGIQDIVVFSGMLIYVLTEGDELFRLVKEKYYVYLASMCI